ncbi:MAG: SDR family oxidoreductase [Acidimicrobiaceae bacterium]|nr:SDR family oxidoreductase [Acidimicrobiaceae bacterium]MYG97877.1 SDR family oxidoreductase [Acidimicrobiaceae bacterium]
MTAGRTALVTGAGSGIGAACVDRFLADGHRVVGVDLRAGRMAERARDLEAIVEIDVADADAVSAIDGVDGIDIVVQCAAIAGPIGPLTGTSPTDWDRAMAVNVSGVVNVMRATLPGMVGRGWGRVVNVASIAGKEGNAHQAAYSASKGAVIALTKSVAKELATTGVLVNAVAPTITNTPLLGPATQEMLDFMVSRVPMGRMCQPEEVAALVGWLCSDECSFSTGACFDITGGRATY